MFSKHFKGCFSWISHNIQNICFSKHLKFTTNINMLSVLSHAENGKDSTPNFAHNIKWIWGNKLTSIPP